MIRTIPENKVVYVGRTPEIANAIAKLMERKTGKPRAKGDITKFPYQTETACDISGWSFLSDNKSLMTLEELEALPDYKEYTEMTVGEISKALGKKIKVVEG